MPLEACVCPPVVHLLKGVGLSATVWLYSAVAVQHW